MRFLCLGYYAPDAYDAMSDEEKKALGERCRPHDEKFFDTGRVLDVASLEHRISARTSARRPGPVGHGRAVRRGEGGRRLVLPDRGRQPGGGDRIASLHPAAQIGWEVGFSMEVRPIETVWVKDGEFVGPGRGTAGR
jgi:hypothetical protein